MLKISQALLIITSGLFFSTSSWSECNDYDAKAAANKATETYMQGKVVQAAVVLKVHRPSKRKEIASYIKAGDLYYTVFTLVDSNCKVGIIKRTNGKH